jgi:pimeloyl-ACP methyl ester carboxylesterase
MAGKVCQPNPGSPADVGEVAMWTSLPLLCALLLPETPAVESSFAQIAPVPPGGRPTRSPGQTRAVVLIHGFTIHLGERAVPRAILHGWQRPQSLLVRELAEDADVFAFAYGQNVSLEDVVKKGGLGGAVRQLRQLGYRDLVLVGHSAGGLIARQFVEDHPEAGVTKVVQVCSPNGGSPAAAAGVARSQRVFLDCLTIDGRQRCLKARADIAIPPGVQFVCVVGTGDDTGGGDGVVSCPCQWTADLQRQGIPAVALPVAHYEAMRTLRGAEGLAEVVRRDQFRWCPDRVREARVEVLRLTGSVPVAP